MSQDKKDIDDVSGVDTTGHSWDGIKELNNPLPRWWIYTFYATIVWAVAYCIAFPAIPLITSATGGLLGYSSREAVEQEIVEATDARSDLIQQVRQTELTAIRDDAELFRFAVAGGESAYKVNCIQCHGSGAQGGGGYPNLNDDDWIWGGTVEDIHQTIAHGIRHEPDFDSRFSEMPRFGEDGLLERDEITQVAEYVLKISNQSFEQDRIGDGEEIYLTNCAACHGDAGEGLTDLGAPNLTDAIWLYGNTRSELIAQIAAPQQGVMPAWVERLDDVTLKQLAVYVHALGGGER